MDELAALRLRYPTMLKSRDRTKLRLSRLPKDDPRIANDVEMAYARWIDGDPFNVLRAIFIFARPEDEGELTEGTKRAG
jgi:hypothetical protein